MSDIVPAMPKFVTDSGERMDPTIVSFLMQASMAAQLSQMRMMQEERKPIGYISYEFEVTYDIFTLNLLPHWISFTVRNDSDEYEVDWAVNHEEGLLTNAPLSAQGELDVDFEWPGIHTIYFKVTSSGGSVTVRIFGKQGVAS